MTTYLLLLTMLGLLYPPLAGWLLLAFALPAIGGWLLAQIWRA